MSDRSKIEWCDTTWNPTSGCTKVSQGCKNCFAECIAKRFWGDRKFGDVQCHPERLNQPLHWRKPRRVFVDSMSDLFHEDVPFDFTLDVLDIIKNCPQHTFMILTKRPERMLELAELCETEPFEYLWPLPNVWLGVSVENQATADERIPLLLKTPAAVRFVSCEPLLGPVDMRVKWARTPIYPESYRRLGVPVPDELWSLNDALYSRAADEYNPAKIGLDWVICGGESGPDARPMHPDWARSLRDQCQSAGVPFFFKQWGEFYPSPTPIVVGVDYGSKNICVKLDGKIGNQLDYAAGQAVIMDRVGKKAAGRRLDSREWNEVPGAGAGE